MNRIIEIRSYNLKPDTRAEFHQLVLEQSLPMMRRWQVDVVAFGPSLHDADSYYLIRSYASLEERADSQEKFYGSAEWRDGPRQAIVSLIETSTSAVIKVDDATLQSLRKLSTY